MVLHRGGAQVSVATPENFTSGGGLSIEGITTSTGTLDHKKQQQQKKKQGNKAKFR
jgi:hypothetical protein